MVEEDLVAGRGVQGLLVSCTAVFLALFLINYIDYIRKIAQNDYVEWDVKTVTAGDYAIEFDIEPQFFQAYLDKEMDNWIEKCTSEGRLFLSRVQSFQAWIQNEME